MLFRKLRRSGVTLAEAMVMVIVAGSLMVPVIGTLQQGVYQTTSLELRTALQNLAESKMAEITYKSLYEGSKPTGEVVTTQYPNPTYPEYTFTLTVEVLNDPTLDDDNGEFTGNIHADLLAVSVVASVSASLIGEMPDIEPVSLMTAMCPPPSPPDYVYTAHPTDKTIGVVNPMIPDLITEIPVSPETPMQLAVHPSGKYLAIKCPQKVLMLDLVSNSFTTIYTVTSPEELCGETTAETGEGNNGAALDRGLLFRPDGKFLYLTQHASTPKIIVLKPTGTPTDPWAWSVDIPMNTDKACDLRLLDDGTVMVANGVSSNNRFYRLSMHTHTAIETYAAGSDPTTKTNEQYAIAHEWGGNNAFARVGNLRIARFNTHAPTDYLSGQISGGFSDFTDTNSHSLLMGPNNLWLFAGEANTGGSGLRLAAFKLASQSIELSNNTISRGIPLGAASGGRYPVSQLEYSPYREQIIAKTTDNTILLFPSIAAVIAGSYATINVVPQLVMPSAIADVKGRLAEYAWLICSDGAASHTIECIDIYGQGSSSLSDHVISLPQQPRGIALNASGYIGAYSFQQTGAGPKKLNVSDYSVAAFPNGINFPTLGRAVKTTFLLDGSLLVLSEKANCDCHKTGDFYPGMGLGYDDMHNGFLLYEADSSGNPQATPCLGFVARAESGSTGFKIRDLAPMHRRNGAYVLMSRDDQTDSLLLWIERSRMPGYTPQLATESYRIMGYWRSIFDGFPTRSARKLALSADDTVLAIYDNQGNGTKQAFYFYDLTNNRFPTTAGLVYNRYKDGAPSNPTNTYYDNQLNSNYPNTTVDPLKPGNMLTASTTLTTDPEFKSNWPVDFNSGVDNNEDNYYALAGYFYNDSPANYLGFASSDCSRLAKNGYFPYRTSSTGSEPWVESGGPRYVAFEYLPSIGSGSVQFDYFSDDAPLNAIYRRSTTDNFSGSWATCASMSAQMFRPFKFRPALIKEVLMNGVSSTFNSVPDVAHSNTNDFFICFNRDAAIPTLFFIDSSSRMLRSYNIFSEKFQTSALAGLAEDLSGDLAQVSDMKVTPDGLSLLVSGRDASSNGKVLMTSISYTPGTPGKLHDAISWKTFTTQQPPREIAVRPFNGFSSLTNNYPATITSGASTVSGYGSHRAAVADGGIYFFGGSDGIDAEPNNDRVYRLRSDLSKDLITAASMTYKLKDLAAVPFDDNKILLIGGEAPSEDPQSSVSIYDAKQQTFVQDGYEAVRPDDNSEKNKLRRHAAAATPYGPVIIGGKKGDDNTGLFDITMNSGWTAPSVQLNPTATNVSGTHLHLSDNDTEGSAYLTTKYVINDGTSFITSFKSDLDGKDGLCFVVHNDPVGATKLGGGNAGLGYTGITNSLAVWIDTRGGNNAPFPSASDDKNFVAPTHSGNAPDITLGTSGIPADYYKIYPSHGLGGNVSASSIETYWWVVYDGQRNKLNVWSNSSNNPETATWAIKDYPADLATLVGGAGSDAFFGFTGASNDGSDAQVDVYDWKLKIWEKASPPGNEEFNYGSFSAVPSEYILRGPDTPSFSSNMIRITSSSSDHSGAVWYDTTVNTTNIDFIATEFCIRMIDSNHTGMAFLIQGNGLINASTGSGGLGYSGIGNSVLVEFDTGDSGTWESDGNHVWVTKNGDHDGDHAKSVQPTSTMNASNIRNWVWVEYDGPANNLRVFMNQNTTDTQPAKPTVPMINHIFSAPLDTIVGPTAHIGFTAHCGTSGQEHCLTMWKLWTSNFSSTFGEITDDVKVYLPNTISGNFPDVAGMLTAQGDGYINEPDHIRLCDAAGGEQGAVWLTNPVTINNNSKFSTHFVVNFTDLSTTPADGMTFIVQGNGNTAITNDVGVGVGYKGITNSIGVELDFWPNAFDSSGNTMAILSGGIHDSEHAEVDNPNGVTLVDSREKHVWIDFDGPNNVVKAYISYNHIKPSTAQATFDFDTVPTSLTSLLGGTNAWFGFGSATGSEYSITRIRAWELIVDNKMIIQFPPRGETLATKPLPKPMLDGVAVTHYSRKQGKHNLYYIGGAESLGVATDSLVFKYDFDTAAWTAIKLWGTDKIDINYGISTVSASDANRRTQVAACSWGDEIFIFGGYRSANTNAAIAFNPDTGKYRTLTNVSGTELISPTAVPYGPFIFLIDGSTAHSGTSGTAVNVLRYKP